MLQAEPQGPPPGRGICCGAGGMGAPIFTSSGDVDALMDQLQTATDALNSDITKWFNANTSNAAARGFWDAWVVWRDSAYGAVKYWRNVPIFKLAWNHYDIAQAKLAELLRWRTDFQKISGRAPSGPGPQVPPGSSASTWLAVAAGVAVLGGLTYIGLQVFGAYKATKMIRPATVSGYRRLRY